MMKGDTSRAARMAALAGVAALAVLGGPGAVAQDRDPDPAFAFPAVFAGPLLPAEVLYSGGPEYQYGEPWRRRMNFDFSNGVFIPIAGGEDFDTGWTIDLKFQAEVVKHLFLGGEFAYAIHDKHPSNVFFDGWMNRFFFLAPIEFDIPFAGHPENPFSVRFGVAPGLQLVDPVVDPDVKDAFEFFNNVKPEEDLITAWDVRARIGLRMPVHPHFGFLFELTYDFSQGVAHTRFKDLSTGESVQPVSRTIQLGGVGVLFLAMEWVF
jgi:hypothetical protein